LYRLAGAASPGPLWPCVALDGRELGRQPCVKCLELAFPDAPFCLGGISPLLTRSCTSTHLEKFVGLQIELKGCQVPGRPASLASWHSRQCFSMKSRSFVTIGAYHRHRWRSEARSTARGLLSFRTSHAWRSAFIHSGRRGKSRLEIFAPVSILPFFAFCFRQISLLCRRQRLYVTVPTRRSRWSHAVGWFSLVFLLWLCRSLRGRYKYLTAGHPDGIALLAPAAIGVVEEAADLASRERFSKVEPRGRARAERIQPSFSISARHRPRSSPGKSFRRRKLATASENGIGEVMISQRPLETAAPLSMDLELNLGAPEASFSYPSGHSTRAAMPWSWRRCFRSSRKPF